MPRLMFHILIAWMFSCFLCTNLFPQDFSIGFRGGIARYFGDINDQKINPYSGMAFDLWPTVKFGLEILGYYTDLKAESGDRFFESEVTAAAALLKIRPFEKTIVSPSLLGGINYFHMNPVDRSGDRLPNNEAGIYYRDRLGVPCGIGFSVFPSEKISFDLDVLYYFSLSDYLDDWSSGNRKDGYLSAALGISLHFGQPKDKDGDGITDKQDADPLHSEDFDGFEDFDGAPESDNDRDGIPDGQDKCPGTDQTVAARQDTKEDLDGFQDNDGCPDPDNDRDGIPDVRDKCPGTAQTMAAGTDTKEDMDGFQDDDGCPDPDNDGDGIPDVRDKCPGTDQTVAAGTDTRETFNGYEDDDGCPDKKPEIAVEKGKSVILEGVYFNTGSAALNPNSMAILDKVVRTLRDNPEIEVEIRGYTDNTGSYNRNVELSKQRAESVKLYLMNNGIDAARIRTRGFGPEDPIAPNTTAEGRARNRRIEFFRIK